jgi:hypothetical protein
MFWGLFFGDNDMTDKSLSGAPWRNFYGRLKGKHMKDTQKGYVTEDLAALSLPNVSWEENPDRTQMDMKAQFGDNPVWLEVGFGGGEHMVHQAIENPDVQFLGCEPYINGVGMYGPRFMMLHATCLLVDCSSFNEILPIAPALIAKIGASGPRPLQTIIISPKYTGVGAVILELPPKRHNSTPISGLYP